MDPQRVHITDTPRDSLTHQGPLAGVRVLDFTHGVAGPFATMILADLGADVVKVEKPGRGDSSRYMNVSNRFTSDIPRSGGDYFLSINRNKLGMTLDLSVPKGLEIALELVRSADVVAQSFRPGVMQRLGLGYEKCAERNPGLVYASVSGYGDRGPLKGQAAMDVVVQARSGVMSITGHPGEGPVKPGVSLSDFSGGVHLATGTLAALFSRLRSGHGQFVEVSLLDATMIMLSNYFVAVVDGEADIEPMGSGHPQVVPFQAFPAQDGSIVIGAGTNKLFRALAEALELGHLLADDRYRSNPDRVANREELIAILASRTERGTVDYWMRYLSERGIPCAPVKSLREAMNDPQVLANDMVQTTEHPIYGTVHVAGIPYKFTDTPCEVRLAAPLLGEHTEKILSEWLQMGEGEVASLRASGVI